MSILSETDRTILLVQTSCGNKELYKYLESELDFIAECQSLTCTRQLLYYKIQLALIEAAQIFARNHIDTSTRTAFSNMQERYESFSDRKTESERTSTGRTCSWSTSTSAQFSVRDSTDNATGFSETNNLRTSEQVENGYDRGYRYSIGHATHISSTIGRGNMAEGEALGPKQGSESYRMVGSTQVSGGTNPLIPLFGTNWTAGSFDTNFPFFHPDTPGPLVPVTFPPSSEALCNARLHRDDNNEPYPSCAVAGYPSYGYGYHGRFEISISLALPGSGGGLRIQVSYEQGKNERQYYHCGSTATSRGETTNGKLASNTASSVVGYSRDKSDETSRVYNLIRKNGFGTRRGFDTGDGEDIHVAEAIGSSYANSNRSTKVNGYQQSRAESLTVQNSESHLVRTETARDNARTDKFSQIPNQLAQLWDRVYERIKELERQLAAVPASSKMACCVPRRRNRYA